MATKFHLLLIAVALTVGLIIGICVVAPNVAGDLGFETAIYADVTVNVHQPEDPLTAFDCVTITNISYIEKVTWTDWIGQTLWTWTNFEGTLEVKSAKDFVTVDFERAPVTAKDWGRDYTLQVKLGSRGSGEYRIMAALSTEGVTISGEYWTVTI